MRRILAMANPEHVKIVKAGRKALDNWRINSGSQGKPCRMDLRGAKLKRREFIKVNLTQALMAHADLSYSCFKGADLSSADLSQANLTRTNLRASCCVAANFQSATLIGADLRGARLTRADLSYARLLRARMNGANLTEADFSAAILCESNLMWTRLRDSNFHQADCRGAHLCNSDLRGSRLTQCVLEGADLTGVWLSGTEPEGCNIAGVLCRFFYVGDEKQRLPASGEFAPGEFEDRFKARPTIEFIFEGGMPGLGPFVIDQAIQRVVADRPDTGLRLLDITGRGGLPRAVIEVASQVSKNDALALVAVYYEQQMSAMRREIEVHRQDKESMLARAFDRPILPAIGSSEGTQKDRPTKAEMASRNRDVAMAVAELRVEHDRLPTVDEVIAKTKLDRKKIYATEAYREGKIAKPSAKNTADMFGASVVDSEFSGEKTESGARRSRRSKADQSLMDALIEKQAQEDSSDRIM